MTTTTETSEATTEATADDTAAADSTMEQAGALAQRMFSSVLATMELLTVYLGTRLGLYEHLRDPRTVAELAAASGVLPRYVQEWCEQQAACGLLHVEDAAAEPAARRFVLPAGHAAALLDPDHPAYVGSVATMAGGMGSSTAAVLDAYRNGTGVSFGAYGDDVRDGQGQFNRAGFLGQLGSAWVPALPGVAPLLERDGATALDVGCGVGWSTIALARAFPGLTVTGVDSDEASVADARRNAAGSDVADRVRFEVRGASEPAEGRPVGSVDVVFFFEALHDMGHPVEALAAARDALRPGGRVVVVDERTLDAFTPDAPEMERLLYGSSVLHCLPVGLSEPGSAGTGALMRPDVLRRYASQSGFGAVEEAPIEHDMFRFWVLTP